MESFIIFYKILLKITKFTALFKTCGVTFLPTRRNKKWHFIGGIMKSYIFSSLIFFVILSLPVYSQKVQSENNPNDSEDYQNSDDIDQFVNQIVSDVQSRIDDFVDQHNDEKIVVEEKDDDKSDPDIITFNGDTEISDSDTIQGDLVVKNGVLTLRGVVNGDVLVVNGDILMRPNSRIRGNARAMNGTITKDDGAVVEGYSEESSKGSTFQKKKTSRAKYSYTFKPFMWFDRDYEDNFLFRYNRAEGFFFGFGSKKKYFWDGSRSLSGHGSFGYGFASHKWRMQLGLDRQFAGTTGLYEIGSEVHSLTDTKDEWIMNLAENNLAALLFHEDFRDYFQREGFSIHTARYTKDGDITTMIDLRYNVDRYTSMQQNAYWALFGGNSFHPNPLLKSGNESYEGMMRSISFAAGLNTVEKYRRRSEGWDAYTRAELAGRKFGGDFDFSQVIVDLRRYQSISDDDQISARIRVGSLEGAKITQRIFELGGANTMPAYGFKEFVGNRMILGNLEYQMSGEEIDEVLFWPDFLNFLLFTDAGAVTNVPTKNEVYEGFDDINASDFKSDLGFALTWNDGDARLGFAWRTDKSAPVAVFFRLKKAF
jgi:hypothetical protein